MNFHWSFKNFSTKNYIGPLPKFLNIFQIWKLLDLNLTTYYLSFEQILFSKFCFVMIIVNDRNFFREYHKYTTTFSLVIDLLI